MGNYKFRLSDMMPNAWFHKLKEMSKPRYQNPSAAKKKPPTQQPSKPKQPHQSQHHQPRKSYYFTRELIPTDPIYNSPIKPDPPRKSSKQRRIKKRNKGSNSSSPKIVNSSSVSAGCSCRATIWAAARSDSPPPYFSCSPEEEEEVVINENGGVPEYRCDGVLVTEESFDKMVSLSRKSCSCSVHPSNAKDILVDVDVDKKSFASRFDAGLSDVELPPIITKPVNEDDVLMKKKKTKKETTTTLSVKIVKEQRTTTNLIRKCSSPGGMKLRINSPRIASKRMIQSHGRRSTSSSSTSRRSLSDSFAIVKSSYDPQRDFTDSMMEMILENNLRESKELEDLLACYLSLNSDEYHDLIIKVFKQIWFDMIQLKS